MSIHLGQSCVDASAQPVTWNCFARFRTESHASDWMNPGALPIVKGCLPTIWPDWPALKSGEWVMSRSLVSSSITMPALVLLTSCLAMQYCNTPAALPRLIDCTFGRAQCVE